ncbi:MAG: TRAP transporter large permease subunit [Alphaproteobacteria bacterium]|nr:TRAP transporter large permease subunit [Alphaproteobacteria bacterium]
MMDLILQIGVVWLISIVVGFPLYATMGLAAFAFAMLGGFTPSIVPQKLLHGVNSFPIVAAPIFILMGNILTAARINDKIVAFATALVGWVRGGYAHASIVASMIFSGMVGSAVADAAGVGAIEIKSMRRVGYRPETAAAITAAAATIGPIIPPSLPFVIYGVAADVSIGRLFLGGFVPGLLMGVSLMVMVAFIAKRQGFGRMPFLGMREIWRTFVDGIWALFAPVLLLAGMFSGIFTPTEAAAVAALYSLFLGFVVYRTLEWKMLPGILVETVETTGLVLALVMAAGALGWCMSISRVPQTITPMIVHAIESPVVFLLVCNAVLLVVGCFMELLAAMLILIPIMVPAAISFGVDPVHFGVMMTINLIIGTIHPPIGVVLFITSRIADISFEAMSKAILPWLVPLLCVLLLVTLWPPLTLWLPGVFMGR